MIPTPVMNSRIAQLSDMVKDIQNLVRGGPFKFQFPEQIHLRVGVLDINAHEG